MKRKREEMVWQGEFVTLSNIKDKRAKMHATYIFQPQVDGGAFVVGTCVNLSENYRFEQRMSEKETKAFYKQLLSTKHDIVTL